MPTSPTRPARGLSDGLIGAPSLPAEAPTDGGPRPSPFAAAALRVPARDALACPERRAAPTVEGQVPEGPRASSTLGLPWPSPLTAYPSTTLARESTSAMRATERALAGLCGRGTAPARSAIDYLARRANRPEIQRALSAWLARPDDGPLLYQALERAGRRLRLGHPLLVERLLRHADWELLIGDPELLTQIGAFIHEPEVFRVLAEREESYRARIEAAGDPASPASAMAILGLAARRRMIFDAILRPRLDALRGAILRQGTIDLLAPLLAFVPQAEERQQLERVVEELSLNALEGSDWLRERLRAAGIDLPTRLATSADDLSLAFLAEHIWLTWRRGMQSDDLAQLLSFIAQAPMSTRRALLFGLVVAPESLTHRRQAAGDWVLDFLAGAATPRHIVDLFGVATFDALMAEEGARLGCPLMAFGHGIARVLLDALPPARARHLVGAEKAEAIWLALQAGQAKLAGAMVGLLGDPDQQRAITDEAARRYGGARLGRGADAAEGP